AGVFSTLLAAPAFAGALLELETPRVVVEAIRDPVTDKDCWCGSAVVFRLSGVARVTLRISRRLASGQGDGATAGLGCGAARGAGTDGVVLGGGELEDVGAIVPFALDARDAGGRVETVAGVLEGDLGNPPVLVVGRVFVRGVDLWDGHVVEQATDIEGAGGP